MHWVTHPRPHVDRSASAWLIRRFIDPKATFGFVGPDGVPPGATPYDLPGAKAGHRDGRCTFETLLADHGLAQDRALVGLAAIVHDLDFHKGKRDESAGLDAILRGMALAEPDDGKVLDRAALVFDALYAREKARLAKVPA